MRPGPSQEEVRKQNLGALLRHVHIQGPTTRAELTVRMGLNRSTIGALTADLADAGLVREETPRSSGRTGRPSLVVRPESGRVYVFAFHLAVDRLVAARVGLGGVVVDRREMPVAAGDLVTALEPLADLVRRMQTGVADDAVCVGAGAAVAGMVRTGDGMVRSAPNAGWRDEPLGTMLSRLAGVDRPMVVGNDADLGALAEHTRGVAAGCDHVVYLHGDVGVGGGIITGGRPLAGHAGYGGEVGHMVVNAGGRRCGCGSSGCWETEIGESRLLGLAGRDGGDGLRGREAVRAVVEAAALGDRDAQAALRQVGDWLGFGVANLVNIFNPDMVVFGGTLRDVYLGAAAQVRSRIATMSLGPCREDVKLRTPALGEDAPLIGAAELAFIELLADPLEGGTRR